jgi:subtilisin family serine protease
LHQPCHAGHDQRCKLGHGAGSRNIALRPRGGSGECGEYSGPGRHTLQSENFSASGTGTQLWFNNDGSAIPGGPFVYNPVAVSGIDNIETTVPNFDPFFGTSAAAPSVAGVVADMLQANPNLTFARVKQILQQTALPFGDPLVAGAGLVDAAAAVQLAMQTATFATTANLLLRTNALDPAGLNPSLNQTLYRIYSIGSDALLAANQLGNVGSDWGFVTLGGFFDGDTADMLLRNSTSGAFQVYNVAPNSINLTGSASLGCGRIELAVLGHRQLQQPRRDRHALARRQ